MGRGAEAGEGDEVATTAAGEFVREFPDRPVALHLNKGSFDSVAASLREPATPLRMTGLRNIGSSVDDKEEAVSAGLVLAWVPWTPILIGLRDALLSICLSAIMLLLVGLFLWLSWFQKHHSF